MPFLLWFYLAELGVFGMSMNNCIKSIDGDSPLRGKVNIGDAVVDCHRRWT